MLLVAKEAAMENVREREFYIAVLGRTLEHLGVQMYKRRDVAIAELVANCWDAGATHVFIDVPEHTNYNPQKSRIVVTDNGEGMNDDEVQNAYLIIGRNRRREGSALNYGRPVMGRKGIGKLAGFGIAEKMTVETWKDETVTTLTLDVEQLKHHDGKAGELPVRGLIRPVGSNTRSLTGTCITLQELRHVTPLDINRLREALSRRFSRVVRGTMRIFVNSIELTEPSLTLEQRVPPEGELPVQLSDNNQAVYHYAFSSDVIRSPELRGFTILVRGKTAQAPPYYFGVEATASGQHATRYLTGTIQADFLDDGTDDQSDIISTDRQEIDWDNPRVKSLHQWGEELTRRILREWANRKGERLEELALQNDELLDRINRLDEPSKRQVSKMIKEVGKADPDPERAQGLVDSIIRAYEYRHFHDAAQRLEAIGENPEQLQQTLIHLQEWKVLESRAILEIVQGRLGVVDTFHSMIVNNAPETASRISPNNMHDLIAGFPWLLNPEWQILAEERQISTQLREWAAEDITEQDELLRYDFLALSDEGQLVIIEIKRSGHPVELTELHRLELYKERLSRGTNKILYMVLLCGGNFNISSDTLKNWESRPDGEIREWRQIYERTRAYYEHYRAVLKGDVEDRSFLNKQREVAKTREILRRGILRRNRAARKEGLGPQDVDYTELN